MYVRHKVRASMLNINRFSIWNCKRFCFFISSIIESKNLCDTRPLNLSIDQNIYYKNESLQKKINDFILIERAISIKISGFYQAVHCHSINFETIFIFLNLLCTKTGCTILDVCGDFFRIHFSCKCINCSQIYRHFFFFLLSFFKHFIFEEEKHPREQMTQFFLNNFFLPE